MSSPFQKAFSAKSPLHNHGNKDIERAKKLSKKDGEDGDFNYESEKVMKLKTRGEEKNASHSNSKEQTNLPSTGDEQQSIANMNYSEKKTEAVAQMRSPLNSYADGGRGEVYLSEVDLIQNAANAVSTAAMDIDNASAESKANRQGKRLDRMKKRNQTTGRKERIDKVQKKYDANVTQAGEDKINNNKNTFSKWLDKNSTALQPVIDAKKASLGIT